MEAMLEEATPHTLTTQDTTTTRISNSEDMGELGPLLLKAVTIINNPIRQKGPPGPLIHLTLNITLKISMPYSSNLAEK